MPEVVAVLGTWQSRFKLRHPELTFVEQAQEAAAGALHAAGMTPHDIDAIVFSLAPTAFMGVADADRWSIDHIFGAGKPMLRVHTGGATGGSAVQAAHAASAGRGDGAGDRRRDDAAGTRGRRASPLGSRRDFRPLDAFAVMTG